MASVAGSGARDVAKPLKHGMKPAAGCSYGQLRQSRTANVTNNLTAAR